MLDSLRLFANSWRMPACGPVLNCLIMDARKSCSSKPVSGPAVAAVLTSAVAVMLGGCRERPPEASGDAPVPAVSRLPSELAQQVLAKVGDRTITLADYALVLDRMDRIERMRYQTPERRRALLEEIINSELLAGEAERRGLDKDPATAAYIDQLFKDEIRRRIRGEVPAPESLPSEEVQAYYAEHRNEFRSPEMRRVAAMIVPNEPTAVALLAELTTKPTVEQWNAAAARRAVKSGDDSSLPVDVVGDLGLVAAPPAARETSTDPEPSREGVEPASKVPQAVRAAAFEISGAGEVFAKPVRADGKVYLVRLLAINPARALSFEEAELEIRTRLVGQRVDARFAALQRELGGSGSGLTPEANK
jgi:peptidyl-prolyl cis-trans isomerase C